MKNYPFIISNIHLLPANNFRRVERIQIREPQIPILTDRTDNVLFELRIEAAKGDILTKLVLQIEEVQLLNISEAYASIIVEQKHLQREGTYYKPILIYPAIHWVRHGRRSPPTRSNRMKSVRKATFLHYSPTAHAGGDQLLWVSIQVDPTSPLTAKLAVDITDIQVNRKPVAIEWNGKAQGRRLGIGVTPCLG